MTTGVVTNAADGLVNQSSGCNVFASSATIALAYPPAVVGPGPTPKKSPPPAVKENLPQGLPPFFFHELTVLFFASSVIPQTPFATPPHPLLVLVYNMLPIAVRSQKRALG